MSKHTPGPWAVGITSPERDPFVVTADDGTKYHRRVTVAETGPRPGVGEFMAAANARLIAAAPDGLTAAEEALACLMDSTRGQADAIRLLQAFLKKARGQ